jgi:hypothetical protein
MESTVKIGSVSDYINITNNFEPNFIYRGHANNEKEIWKLLPSIARLYNSTNINDLGSKHGYWRDFEEKILKEFERKSITYIQKLPKNEIDWMVLGQHYGLPTRLLDWTQNPLVALFFAIIDDSNVESHVWAASIVETWSINAPVDTLDNVIKLLPSQIDSRIISQNGCFTIHPLPAGITPITPLEELFDNEEGDSGILELTKIVIPDDSKLKDEMLIQLGRQGIDYSFIFPDLTGLCKQLKIDFL